MQNWSMNWMDNLQVLHLFRNLTAPILNQTVSFKVDQKPQLNLFSVRTKVMKKKKEEIIVMEWNILLSVKVWIEKVYWILLIRVCKI
jgi:hypothetical protein